MKFLPKALMIALLMLMLAATPAIQGNSSGKHNQAASGCGCHSNGGGVTATNDFPTSYTAGQVYSINIGHAGAGSLVGGFNVVVNKGTLQNAGNGVQISGGSSATHVNSGQLGWTFDWQAPTTGSGSVTVNIAVLQANGNGQTSGDAWDTDSVSITETVVQNIPPVATNVHVSTPQGSASTTQAYPDEVLMASYDYNDDNGDPETMSQIRWYKSGNLDSAYNDMEIIDDMQTTIGDTWTFTVTPNDGTDLGTTVSASNTIEIIDYDTDNDGYGDQVDAFPNDPNEHADADGDGTGDNADLDDDNDGTKDADDAFPFDSTENTDTDGDGTGNNADTDDDADGVLDVNDAFPLDANEDKDTDNDGTGDNADTDDDGDGTLDADDAFPLDASEDNDADGDGTGDNADQDDDNDGALDVNDAFPLDASESLDTDDDGTGDNADTDDDNDGALDADDAFPLDATETVDTDDDGTGDNADTDDDNDGTLDANDAFPLDATETIDTDADGIGDNADTDDDNDGLLDADEATLGTNPLVIDTDEDGEGDGTDAFPLDATETSDADGDGVGDNADAFPNDATESIDSDQDGVGNNADAFPNDASETSDSDEDGVGDNADWAPLDATESIDTDNDGVGDNADAFPEDSSETMDSDGDGVGDVAQAAAEADAEALRNMIIIALLVVGLLGGGAVMFLRGRGGEEVSAKSFDQPFDASTQSIPAAQPTLAAAPAVVQQQVQPVVEEPTVLRQWTDEKGYTWRSMSDGSNYWWTGTEWQRS